MLTATDLRDSIDYFNLSLRLQVGYMKQPGFRRNQDSGSTRSSISLQTSFQASPKQPIGGISHGASARRKRHLPLIKRLDRRRAKNKIKISLIQTPRDTKQTEDNFHASRFLLFVLRRRVNTPPEGPEGPNKAWKSSAIQMDASLEHPDEREAEIFHCQV